MAETPEDILKRLEERQAKLEANIGGELSGLPKGLREDVEFLRELESAMDAGDFEPTDFEESFIRSNVGRKTAFSSKQNEVIERLREKWDRLNNEDEDGMDARSDDDTLQPWD